MKNLINGVLHAFGNGVGIDHGGDNYEDVACNGVRVPAKPSGGGSGLPSGGAPYQQLVTDAEGNAKWEERTHYSEPPVQTVLIPETTASGQGEGGAYVLGIFEGIVLDGDAEYTVVFDGKTYVCKPQEMGEAYFIGNPGVMGSPDDGYIEPFCVYSEGGSTGFVVSDGDEHTYSVTSTAGVNHPLHKKFLPMEDIIAELKKHIVQVTTVEITKTDSGLHVDGSYDELLTACTRGLLLGMSSGRVYIASKSYTSGVWAIHFYRFAFELSSNNGQPCLHVISMSSDVGITEQAYKLDVLT